MTKKIIIHVGPHKTGSTAIQKTLSESSLYLQSANTLFFHNEKTHQAALALANEEFDRAETLLSQISEKVGNSTADTIILSQEDFAGELTGRSRRRAIYPKLTKNLRILNRAFRPHSVTFLFFVRKEENWLRSCYHQHLKHRTRFASFEEFREHHAANFSWEDKLSKPKETFGDDLIVAPYSSNARAGLKCLLGLASDKIDVEKIVALVEKSNSSPSSEQISHLEHINSSSEFKETAWYAKSLVMRTWTPTGPKTETNYQPWPPAIGFDAHSPLPALQRRAQSRVAKQSVADLLPAENSDLRALLFERLPLEATLPEAPRSDMENQVEILNYHLRGKSRLSHLNALVISYLRRDTLHTDKARVLFHRIWREHGVLLVNELSTRWLISTLQTFLDHGQNKGQQLIGTTGFFYANMMKIYEGERAIECREQDAVYNQTQPLTPNRFRGMDRYNVGGSDLLLNTNALALELAQHDDVAGLVLTEFLLRVKHSANVFYRHDRTRKEQEISVPGFEDTWAFFDPL